MDKFAAELIVLIEILTDAGGFQSTSQRGGFQTSSVSQQHLGTFDERYHPRSA